MTSAIARWHSSARPPSDALEQSYADQLEAEMQEMAIQLHKVTHDALLPREARITLKRAAGGTKINQIHTYLFHLVHSPPPSLVVRVSAARKWRPCRVRCRKRRSCAP